MDNMSMTTGAAMATTGAMATATSAAAMDMEDMMGGCKISMLWNWNVMDACFISSSWHITSKGMFAGSCIGVILLVMSLELLRRASKEYDQYIIRQHRARSHVTAVPFSNNGADSKSGNALDPSSGTASPVSASSRPKAFRPSLLEQAVRATLHMVQFTIAYFIMLLAMYYNGYIIISIIIGAWLGAFVFSWGPLDGGGPKEDSTYCCG